MENLCLLYLRNGDLSIAKEINDFKQLYLRSVTVVFPHAVFMSIADWHCIVSCAFFLHNSHPTAYAKLPSLIRPASSSDLQSVPPAKRHQTLAGSWSGHGGLTVSQAKVNELIINFVIGDMQAFSVVESPEFVQLVTRLQPGKTVMTRKTLVGKYRITEQKASIEMK